MTPKKRKATESAGGSTPSKRASKGRAAKKQDDPVWATENENSHLVNQDLHAKYCDPATYENWTKEDWEEIHDCLPDNAPRNDDGYSVPISFFKHDSDWRRLVREFQEDLGAGRYEPQWLKEAAKAMEERAAGKFDKYKEDQFEAFWGQKQKLRPEDLAGESAKIKLNELVEAGRIKLGDDLSFRRAFEKKGLGKWMIEKEIKIVAINGSLLTVAIPPGQTKFSKFQNFPGSDEENFAKEGSEGDVIPSSQTKLNGIIEHVAQDLLSDDLGSQGEDHGYLRSVPKLVNQNGSEPISAPGSPDFHQTDSVPNGDKSYLHEPKLAQEGGMEVKTLDKSCLDVNTSPKAASNLAFPSEIVDSQTEREDVMGSQMAETNGTFKKGDEPISSQGYDTIDPKTGCILHQLKTIKSFVDKIIGIDGRLDPKDAPILSNWRLIRLQRNNQDLGSLFDVREDFYVWKSPTIVKTPKKGRVSSKVQADGKELNSSAKSKPQLSKQDPVAKKSAKKASAKDLDDENEMEESDEPSASEQDSDSDFKATNAYNSKSKSKKMARIASKRSKELSSQDHDAVGDDVLEKSMKEIPKKPSGKPSCPNCGNTFTTDYSRKRHIEKFCKSVAQK